MQPRGTREAGQPARIAPDPGQRQVDQGIAAGGTELVELLDDQGLVTGELPVVPAALDVPQRDLGVLVRQGEPELAGIDRTEDGLDARHGAILAVIPRDVVDE